MPGSREDERVAAERALSVVEAMWHAGASPGWRAEASGGSAAPMPEHARNCCEDTQPEVG